MKQVLNINLGDVTLDGDLNMPDGASGLVIFSHGSGSSRFSPRNNFVAQHLQRRGLATFVFDLLTKAEEEIYRERFNIELLSDRLIKITQSLLKNTDLEKLSIGYFGASTGAASALTAASILKNKISAIVSRGGRPDLAIGKLSHVKAPTLLVVGALDVQVLEFNKKTLKAITATKELVVIPNATHLFEEPGTLEKVASISGDWFTKFLTKSKAPNLSNETILT